MPNSSRFQLATELLALLPQVGAEGGGEALPAALNILGRALARSDEKFLHAVSLLLDEQGSPEAEQAYNCCIDVLCSAGGLPLGPHAEGWRCTGLGVLAKKPRGYLPVYWEPSVNFLQHLADVTGLAARDIYVDSIVLPSEQAFSFSPVQAYRHCQLVCSRAGGLRLPFLRNSSVGIVDAYEGTADTFEAIIPVAFKTNAADIEDLLAPLVGGGYPFELSNQEHRFPIQILETAPPWLIGSNFLNTSRALRFYGLFSNLCNKHNLSPIDLNVWVACVEVNSTLDHLRIGITGPDGTLLAGIDEENIYSLEMYVSKLVGALSELGANVPFVLPVAAPLDVLVNSEGLSQYPLSMTGWGSLPRFN